MIGCNDSAGFAENDGFPKFVQTTYMKNHGMDLPHTVLQTLIYNGHFTMGTVVH